MKILFVGDVHLSDVPPSTRVDGYADQILAKLVQILSLARKESVDAVVYSGDIFHSKIPGRTSHWLVRRAIRVFAAQAESCRVFVVPGNHDYPAANIGELARTPLGVMAESGAIELLGAPPSPQLSLGGLLFEGVREEERTLDRFARVEADVVVCHSAIFPPGDEPPFDHFTAPDVAAALGDRTQLVLYGHIHDPHGAYGVDGKMFVNPGSLSRGSLYEADPQRIPKVALVEWISGEISVEFVPLDVVPWDKVFRVEVEGAKRERAAGAEAFAEALSQASLEAFSIERVVSGLRDRDDAPETVRERAVELIETVGG